MLNDTSDFSVSDLVWIEVLSADYPEITSPANQTLAYGFTDENITWIPTERTNSPDSYVVYRNGSIFTSGSWSNQTPIVVSLDSINTTVGNHNFTIVLNDTSDFSVSDLVWITVASPISPEVNAPANQTLECGFSGENITWIPTERSISPDSYIVYRNGSIFASDSWSNQTPIVINLDSINLTLGNHNFTIVINDTTDLTISDLVWITVQDTTNPTLNSPSDITYELGDTGNSIVWIGTDLKPNNYTVYKNASINETGSWISAGSITIYVNGLSIGTWNFTIWINDTSGNNAYDIVFVFVTAPINDPSIFSDWFNTTESITADTSVIFYVELYDIDNISSELSIILYYTFSDFPTQNLSVSLSYVSLVATDTYRFEYTFAGQSDGTTILYYYQAYDGASYVKEDNSGAFYDLDWLTPATTIVRPIPDKKYPEITPKVNYPLAFVSISILFLLVVIFLTYARKDRERADLPYDYVGETFK